MGLSHSPKIATNGLTLCLDAANPKSYSGSGSTWFDVSGNGNHMTLYNNPTYSGGNLFFDGNNQYGRIASLDLSGTNAVTVQYIMKAASYPSSGLPYDIHELSTDYNSVTTGFVASFNNTSAGQNYQVGIGTKGDVGVNWAVYNKTLLNGLNWVSICFIHDKSQASTENLIYYNGAAATPIINPATGYTSNNTNNFGNLPFYLASRGGTTYFAPMNVSSLLLYNRALSVEEIDQNYNAHRGRYNI